MSSHSSEENRSKQRILEVGSDLPPKTQRIYLIRHAQARSSDPDRPPMDPGLTELGRQQAQVLKEHYREAQLDLIATSEMQRARETAEAIREVHPEIPFQVRPELNEVHGVGDWRRIGAEDAGRLAYEVMYRPDHQCPMGETPRLFHRRISRCWEDLLAGGARNILIVAHGGVVGVMISLSFGLTEGDESHCMIAYPNAASSEIWVACRKESPQFPDRVTIIRYLCRREYLPPSLVTI